jgi:hypothetical protein
MAKKSKGRKRRSDATGKARLGIAWFKREQWDHLLKVSADREDLEDSYDEWAPMAEKRAEELRQQGYACCKVIVDVEELLSWCNLRNRAVDSEARAEFVISKLHAHDEVEG